VLLGTPSAMLAAVESNAEKNKHVSMIVIDEVDMCFAEDIAKLHQCLSNYLSKSYRCKRIDLKTVGHDKYSVHSLKRPLKSRRTIMCSATIPRM
jgi:superfamily II DNA/RNA helicase